MERTRTGRSIRAAAAVLGLAFGCGEDDDSCAVRSCDIREAECQRALGRAVACMRGSTADLPPIHVITEAEFIERVTEDQASESDLADYEHFSRGLARFRLAPESFDPEMLLERAVAEVGAAYSPQAFEIVVIDRGMPMNDDEAIGLLAHELVHAFQDADHDLIAFEEQFATSFDSRLAAGALVEGEAVHYQLLVMIDLVGRTPDEFLWDDFYSDWKAEMLDLADSDEAPLEMASLRFPYAFGGHYVSDTWLSRGQPAVDALFERPPRSTGELLFQTADELSTAGERALQEQALPSAGESYESIDVSALGSWMVRGFLRRVGLSEDDAWWSAGAVASDVFSVQRDPAIDEVVAAWHLWLRSDRLGDWPEIVLPDVQSWQIENDAFLVSGPPEVNDLAEDLAWLPAPEPDDASESSAAASARGLPRLFRYGCAQRVPLRLTTF